ncbi:MAG: sulfite exporter TauE/SafE family protein [Oscillospiraceae bacterium]|nr:sulfite exporter TauE/SafE family protein [Oscillospiraceae bacterium]
MPKQETKQKSKAWYYPLGFTAGLLNGFLGAGGGMAIVPMLRGLKVEQKKCHATSLMIMLPLAVSSGFLYLRSGSFLLSDSLVYLPGGLLGAFFGGWLLPRLKTVVLRRVFSLVMIFAGVKLIGIF